MTTEHEQAKAWRTRARLTLDELAGLTGYSREALWLFEQGRNSKGEPIPARVWRRYKAACLAVRLMLAHNVKSIAAWEWD